MNIAKFAIWTDDCPNCKKANFWDEDEDMEGLICFSCGKKWLFDYFLQGEEWKFWFNSDNLEEVLEDEAELVEGRPKI